jgi:hypothetical protein
LDSWDLQQREPPLDAVKATSDVVRSVVDVQNLNNSVFNDEAFKDDIGNSSAYDGSTTDTSLAWETNIKNWGNITEEDY